ncbi:MAG TPA: trypsin-like serine protease [Thermoanaerobaculia bacterium]
MTCSCAQQQESGYELDALGELFEEEDEFGNELDQESEIIGPDSRILTKKTTLAPFRYICNMESGGQPFCTGTLIGSRTLLTAKHCLEGETEKGGVRIIPGRNGSSEPFKSTTSEKFVSYDSADIALVHLKDPIGDTVGFWTRTHSRSKADPIGTSILSGSLPLPAGTLKVNVSGYPGDMPLAKKYACRDPKAKGARCTFNQGAGRSNLCGAFQYRSYDVTVKRDGNLLRHTSDTCGGHSGSPVWVRRHWSMGGRVLVAVHVGSNTLKKKTTNRAVLIDKDILKFIIANTK